MKKPRLAVHKFSSCDGCQLGLLNLEDELLDLVEVVEIAYFLEATSNIQPGPYDISLVEGSVSTPHEVERIKMIREGSRNLISIGTCATAGGIQALRNFTEPGQMANAVYNHPEYLDYLDLTTPLSNYVKVDLEVWGCPVNKYQVLEGIIAQLQRRRPNLPTHSVCLDCKRNGTVCVLVAQGIPCVGPVTRTGCGAICPANGRGCYGCFGPSPVAELEAMLPLLQEIEEYPDQSIHLLRNFAGYAPAFRNAVDTILEENSKK